MSIGIRQHKGEDFYCPVLLCDICGLEITDDGMAMIAWYGEHGSDKAKVVHKIPCLRTMERHNLNTWSLEHWWKWLVCNNWWVSWVKKEARFEIPDSIGIL